MLIEIKGQSYELWFGMRAVEIFYRKAGLVQEESLFNTEQLTAMLWGGLQNGAYRQERILPLSFAAVSDWVEKAYFQPEGQEILSRVVKEFQESQALKDMAKATAESDKKKVPVSQETMTEVEAHSEHQISQDSGGSFSGD